MSGMTSSEALKTEYQALTTGCGFVELKDWSTVTMTGADRQAFLHNMCTNDISHLTAGESCEAFCTNVQGKIVAHVVVIAREDRLMLLTVPGQAETLINHLDRYIIREDVTLTEASGEATWMFVGGGKTASELTDIDVARSAIARSAIEGLPGCLLGGAVAELQSLHRFLIEAGGVACCQETWETVRIESKLPLFGIDFDSTNLPQEVDRNESAIHFNKGCYLGQETIARIDALGHVNQKVVLVRFEGETTPPVGLELSANGKSIGRVTSCCWSPRIKAPLALATVRRSSNAIESQLESDLGVATVTELFGKPDRKSD